jgi:hypothetical protein
MRDSVASVTRPTRLWHPFAAMGKGRRPRVRSRAWRRVHGLGRRRQRVRRRDRRAVVRERRTWTDGDRRRGGGAAADTRRAPRLRRLRQPTSGFRGSPLRGAPAEDAPRRRRGQGRQRSGHAGAQVGRPPIIWALHRFAPEATNAAYSGLPHAIIWHFQLSGD